MNKPDISPSVSEALDLIELYFSPWSSAKAARWGDATNDSSFDAEVALRFVEKILRAPSGERQGPTNEMLRPAYEEIWCLREVVRGVRIMANSGAFKEFEGEPWLKRVRNINIDEGFSLALGTSAPRQDPVALPSVEDVAKEVRTFNFEKATWRCDNKNKRLPDRFSDAALANRILALIPTATASGVPSVKSVQKDGSTRIDGSVENESIIPSPASKGI